MMSYRCSILPSLDIMQFFLAQEINAARGFPFRGCLSRDDRHAVGFLGLGVEPLLSPWTGIDPAISLFEQWKIMQTVDITDAVINMM